MVFVERTFQMWFEDDRNDSSDDLDAFTYELMKAICGEASVEFETKPVTMEDRMLATLEKLHMQDTLRPGSSVVPLPSKDLDVAL